MVNKSDIICKYHNKGVCRRQNSCSYRQTQENCEDLSCEMDNCDKRHPKVCMFFSYNRNCKYKDKCLFRHDDTKHDKEYKSYKQEYKHLNT